MTANRKAELQRKLALAPVPKPPAGLADRIKGEIPKELLVDADKERNKLRQAVAFNMRVAASIILLVSSVYLALHLLSQRFGPPEMGKNAAAPTAAVATVAEAPQTQLTRARDLPSTAPAVLAAPQQPQEAQQLEAPKPARKREFEEQKLADAERRVDAVAPPAAPAVAPPPPPPAVAEAQREERDRGAIGNVAGGVAGGSAKDEAITVTAAKAQPAPIRQQSASLVDRFAVADAVAVEAASAPLDESKTVLVVSMHTQARVVFNDAAVASWRTLAAGDTSVYELSLRPGDNSSDAIATARAAGLERVVRRGDLRSWRAASRTTKSAALAAALMNGASPADVAAKAYEAGLTELGDEAASRARQR